MEDLMFALNNNNLLKNTYMRISNIGWELGKLRFVKRGEILYKEGDLSRSVFMILKGSIILMKRNKEGETLSVFFSDKDFFGSKELFTKINRCSEAITLTDSILIELSKDEIQQLVEKDDHIAYNIQKGNSDFKFDVKIKSILEDIYFNSF